MSVEAATAPTAPPPQLSEQDKANLILGVERMKGGCIALGELAAALRGRTENLEARSRMKIGKDGELLFRRAELGTILDLVIRRAQLTAAHARSIILRHPDVFAPGTAPDGQPLVAPEPAATSEPVAPEVPASAPV